MTTILLSPTSRARVVPAPTTTSSSSSSCSNKETKDEIKLLYDSAVAETTRCYSGCDEAMPEDHQSLNHHEAAKTNSSLAFGEIDPSAVDKILDRQHLDAANATVLYDLGSGNGKLAMQAFLQYPNLKKVVGVELTYSRGIRGLAAASRLSEHFSKFVVEHFNEIDEKQTTARSVKVDRRNVAHMMALRATRVTDVTNGRSFELRRQNLFEATDVMNADIIICETMIIQSMHTNIARFFAGLKSGARLLMYTHGLDSFYATIGLPCPFVEINRGEYYLCSWMPTAGCNFQCWRKK